MAVSFVRIVLQGAEPVGVWFGQGVPPGPWPAAGLLQVLVPSAGPAGRRFRFFPGAPLRVPARGWWLNTCQPVVPTIHRASIFLRNGFRHENVAEATLRCRSTTGSRPWWWTPGSGTTLLGPAFEALNCAAVKVEGSAAPFGGVNLELLPSMSLSNGP